jgi:hypothetical protein
MGYIPMNCAKNITVSPTSPIPVRKIDKAEYDRLRRGLLGQNAAILGSENCDPELCDFCHGIDLPLLEYNKEAIENGSYIDDYNQFYEQF